MAQIKKFEDFLKEEEPIGAQPEKKEPADLDGADDCATCAAGEEEEEEDDDREEIDWNDDIQKIESFGSFSGKPVNN